MDKVEKQNQVVSMKDMCLLLLAEWVKCGEEYYWYLSIMTGEHLIIGKSLESFDLKASVLTYFNRVF